jgi:hypothetical protein
MGTVYVARSVSFGKWASDVGLSKHVFKVGVTDEAVKPLVEAGWAGFTDWALLKQQDAAGVTEEEAIERLSAKQKLIDPALYPRLRGTMGVFKVIPAHVENHIIVGRALAGTETASNLKVKPIDFAAFLIHNALK